MHWVLKRFLKSFILKFLKSNYPFLFLCSKLKYFKRIFYDIKFIFFLLALVDYQMISLKPHSPMFGHSKCVQSTLPQLRNGMKNAKYIRNKKRLNFCIFHMLTRQHRKRSLAHRIFQRQWGKTCRHFDLYPYGFILVLYVLQQF